MIPKIDRRGNNFSIIIKVILYYFILRCKEFGKCFLINFYSNKFSKYLFPKLLLMIKVFMTLENTSGSSKKNNLNRKYFYSTLLKLFFNLRPYALFVWLKSRVRIPEHVHSKTLDLFSLFVSSISNNCN